MKRENILKIGKYEDIVISILKRLNLNVQFSSVFYLKSISTDRFVKDNDIDAIKRRYLQGGSVVSDKKHMVY